MKVKITPPKYMIGDVLEVSVNSRLDDEKIEYGVAIGEIVQMEYLPSVGWGYYFPKTLTAIAEHNLGVVRVLRKGDVKYET